MSIGIAKEMADRLIESVLKFFKGESVEDQLTKAIKVLGLVLTVSLFVNFSLFLANLNMRIELRAAEEGLTKIDMLFEGGEGSTFFSFIRVNAAMTQQMNVFREQNNWLIRKVSSLTVENSYLRRNNTSLLIYNERLSKNNDLLLLKCTP